MTATAGATDIPDLVRFVLARLDDEEADLRRRVRGLRGRDDDTTSDTEIIEHLRAEALSRRQIVGSVQQLLVLRDLPNEKAVRDVAVTILRSLATPDAAHPTFRDSWHAANR